MENLYIFGRVHCTRDGKRLIVPDRFFIRVVHPLCHRTLLFVKTTASEPE